MFNRKSIAATLALTTSLSFSNATNVEAIEPTTIAAAATLGSAILSAGNKGSRVAMEFAKANLDIAIATHGRIDKIEDSIASILIGVARLPAEIRNEMKRELEKEKASDVTSLIGSIKERMAVVQNSGTKPWRDDDLNRHFADLRTERNNLIGRSDMVIPTIFQAYVAEISSAHSMNRSSFDIDQMKKIYKERLQKSVDPDREGSLLWTINTLIDDQRKHEKDLSKTVYGTERSFANENVGWFSHSLYKIEDIYEERKAIKRGNPIADEPDTVITYQHKVGTRDVPIHNTDHIRTFTIFPSAFDKSLYRLRVQKSGPRVHYKEIIWYPDAKHTEDDATYEKPRMAEHEELVAEIVQFNNRVESIEETLLAIRLVNLTLSAIEKNVELDSGFLQQELARWEGRMGASAEANERLSREASANWLISQMTKARFEAKETIRKALKNIEIAIEEDKNEAWRGQAIAVLNIISAGAQFTQALEAEAAIARLHAAAQIIENAPNTTSKHADQLKSAGRAVASNSEELQGVQAVNKSNEEKIAEFLTKPVSEMHPIEKINLVYEIADYLGKTPYEASENSMDAKRLRLQLHALSVLDSMAPTVGDKYYQENHKDTSEIIAEILAKKLVTGDIEGALRETLTEAIKPSMVADGSLTSISSQIQVRNILLSDMTKQFRFIENQNNISKIREITFQDALSCKDGCFRRTP